MDTEKIRIRAYPGHWQHRVVSDFGVVHVWLQERVQQSMSEHLLVEAGSRGTIYTLGIEVKSL